MSEAHKLVKSRRAALAKDAVLEKLILPCGVQPKIDGVRGLNMDGTFTGRSQDPFKGFGITDYFSIEDFVGLDGECTLGDNPASLNRLCSLTTGAMGRFKDVTEMAEIHWWLFDYVTPTTADLAYEDRYELLKARLLELNHPRLHLVPMTICTTIEEVKACISVNADFGFEGTCTRNLKAPHKEDRPGAKVQELMRFKPWLDSEILVTGITEGSSNHNEAKRNSLGYQERSTAKAGLVPNGMVGSIQGTILEDVFHPITKQLLFAKGLPVTIAPGEMTDDEALYYFQNQGEIVGHIAKFKHMTHGVKDLPRMGQFKTLRIAQDMPAVDS